MKISSLQRTDRLLGIPACFILTCFRALFLRDKAKDKIRRILFIKFAEQGSTVLAYPAIRKAVEKVGRENVFFIVFDDNRFILDALKIIPEENVITLSFKNFGSLVKGAVAAIFRMRREKIDAAVDMEFFARSSAAVALLSGAWCRVGFHSFYGEAPYRGNLMTHRLLYNPHLHTSQTFQVLVEALDCNPKTLPTMALVPKETLGTLPQIQSAPADLEAVKNLLRQSFGISDLPRIVLLNPNASDLLPLRKWPAERYVELARQLLSKFSNVRIVMTGGPNEADAIAALAAQVGSERCVSFAGKTTFRELLALYALSEVLVTNDSGPAHFAVLTPIHVVTLFGPETPLLYAAPTPRNVPLWAGIACSPCINAFNNRQSPCRDNLCMKAITVEQVFAEVCSAYERRTVAIPD